MAKKMPRAEEREERHDHIVMIAGREILWSKDWDDPDDYSINEERLELDGFQVGERVICTEDYEDPSTGFNNAEEGAEGIIIGITHPHPGGGMFNNPAKGPMLCVGWNDRDPSDVEPAYVEGI
jgi:hypothetical protein